MDSGTVYIYYTPHVKTLTTAAATGRITGYYQAEGADDAAQRPGFSRRLTALANATSIGTGMDSDTQKTPDLARRKAVGCNPLLDGDRYRPLQSERTVFMALRSVCARAG
jgi:hypothetical protein